jgi:hypothetical protein
MVFQVRFLGWAPTLPGVTKFGNPPKIDETPPIGPRTHARPPIEVSARVRWNYGPPGEVDVYEHSWVMAWTKEQVYVYLHDPRDPNGQLVWLRADQVQRAIS